jgi:hypothetical protein
VTSGAVTQGDNEIAAVAHKLYREEANFADAARKRLILREGLARCV